MVDLSSGKIDVSVVVLSSLRSVSPTLAVTPECLVPEGSRLKTNVQEAVWLAGKRIAILVAEGVEGLEFYVPPMRLQEEGAKVLAAGLDLRPVRGKHGLEVTPLMTIADLRADDLFALVLPGGWVA